MAAEAALRLVRVKAEEPGRTDMKKDRILNILAFIIPFGIFSLSGCYTVLMTSSDSAEGEGDLTSSDPSQGDYSSEISYNQNCLSCHSQAELDDRYYDMQSVGMVSAHGMNIDPYGWKTPAASVPWWYEVIAPVPSTAVSSATPASGTQSGPRTRTTGSTRGSDGTRTRGTTDASTPVPTTAPASASAPATSGATAVARDRTGSETPAATPGRARTDGASTSPPAPAPRKTGSGRGDDKP